MLPFNLTRFILSGPTFDVGMPSLRYHISHDTSSWRITAPKNGAIPPPWYLVSHRHICAISHLQHIQQQLCDTPHKQTANSFALLSLQVSHNIRSIAAEPLKIHWLPAHFWDWSEDRVSVDFPGFRLIPAVPDLEISDLEAPSTG